MTAKRISFIHTPNRYYSEVQNNGVIFMPVWAYTLAAHIPDDGRYELDLIDIRMDSLDEALAADTFLFSGVNQDFPDIIESLARLRKRFPNAAFIIGGPICWSFGQVGELEKLDGFDHIVIGDGEDIIAGLLEGVIDGSLKDKVIRNDKRFDLSHAHPFYRLMVERTADRYYGAVLEVSRGCPFLCEFCDIRILPDNNHAHNKDPQLIIDEIDYMCSRGVTSFLLACDNLIGDPRWAERVVDAILQWRETSPHRPVFYTWLTLNLYKMPGLMKKMRRAGFDTLFIGVESFDSNSLLETAKMQNIASGVVGAVRDIQSFGFPIVAGLIFGFDSDNDDCFDKTVDGLLETGLLSGDPSLLTALPGTPLYQRMQLAGRIRDSKYGLGGHKYHTNILYLLPKHVLRDGYLKFARKLGDGAFQFARFKAFIENLERGNYVPLAAKSYFSLKLARRVTRDNPTAIRLALHRLWLFVSSARNLKYLAKALWLLRRYKHIEGRYGYLRFWLAVWTTIIVKYSTISADDFDIESLDGDIDAQRIIPNGYAKTMNEPIPAKKIAAQRRETLKSLEALVTRRATTDKL